MLLSQANVVLFCMQSSGVKYLSRTQRGEDMQEAMTDREKVGKKHSKCDADCPIPLQVLIHLMWN